MRVINRKRLGDWVRHFPDAADSLYAWHEVARKARWRSLQDVRSDFPNADGVRVSSGRTVTVFNIRGNHYRLLTAIHYNTQVVFVMRFITHAEYSKNLWRQQL